MDEPRHFRLKKIFPFLFACRRHRGQRPSVKAIDGGNDFKSTITIQRTIFSRQFYRAFVGFGATAGKKHPVKTGTVHKQSCIFNHWDV